MFRIAIGSDVQGDMAALRACSSPSSGSESPSCGAAAISSTTTPPQTGRCALSDLLRAADADSNWHVASEAADVLRADFAQFLRPDGAERPWRRMCLFLSTIDALLARESPEYRASRGWSASRTQGWYGFLFGFETPKDRVSQAYRYWIGLSRVDGADALSLYLDGAPIQSWPLRGELVVSDLVQTIVAIVDPHRR